MLRLLPLLLLLGGACTGGQGDTDDTDARPAPTLLGIGLSPREPVATVGDEVRFQVKAFYDDTSTEDITGSVTWVSTEPRVATVDDAGRVTALAAGEAGIVATDTRGVATRTTLTVRGDADAPTDLALAPRTVQLRVGEQVELQARATYADGTTGNLAPRCTWALDDGAVASVADGLLVGVAEGRTTVRATCAGLDAAAPVTVEPDDATLALPDLTITDQIVEASGDDVLALVEIRNDGDGMSPVGFVDLFLDSDGPPDDDDAFVQTALVDALGPGDTALALLEAADIAAGPHDVWLVVDADDWIEESDEGDNVAGPFAVEVGGGTGPQLVVDTFEALTDGSYTLYTIEVRNTGDEVARDFWLDLWYDPPSDPGVCDTGDDFTLIGTLAPGETLRWEPDVDEGPSSAWLSVLFVDSCDDVDESDESDNLGYVIVEE